MKLLSSSVRPLVAALSLVFCAGTARALSDAEASAGRSVVKLHADAIVGVEMVVTIKVTVGGRAAPPREHKVDVNGTVIDANGLTVTSLASIDPKIQFEAMRSTMAGAASKAELGDTDYKEVNLRLADGTEIPARVVLKDADLDLAFIAPLEDAAEAKREIHWVNLDEVAEGELLGTYFSITRAPKTLQRVPVVRPTLLIGIVEKPRRQYLVTDHMTGSPVFDQKGRVLGLALQQPSAGRGGLVVLPAADVAEIAKQAQAARLVPAPAEPSVKPTAEPEAPAVAEPTGKS